MKYDWEALRNIIVQFIEEYLSEVDKSFDRFYEKLAQKLKDNGYAIDNEIEQFIEEFSKEHIEQLKEIISYSVSTIISKPLSDPIVKKIVQAVFEYRYPDGLTLSQRLWNWSADMSHDLKEALKLAIWKGNSANNIVYELQYLIEGYHNNNFAITIKEKIPNWIKHLKEAFYHGAKLQDRDRAKAIIDSVERYINKLSKQGTYTSAKHLVNNVKKAIELGKEELIDRSIRYHIYQKQLTRLKTIARTEISNAYHQAQLVLTEQDKDLIGYRWRLSKSHPKPDICDYLANVDYGLGKGVHPKEKVPRTKAHPNCMCYLEPVYRFEVKGDVYKTPKIDKQVLEKFAPNYIKKLGGDIEDYFNHQEKRFLRKEEIRQKLTKQ